MSVPLQVDHWPQSVQVDHRRKIYVTWTRFHDIVGAVFNRDEIGRVAIENRGYAA